MHRETLHAFARSEGVLGDLRRLLGFLESRADLTWVEVGGGHLLQAGETVGPGA